jgi:hypothetical protein
MLGAAGAGKRTLAVALCALSSIAIQACGLFFDYLSAAAVLLPFVCFFSFCGWHIMKKGANSAFPASAPAFSPALRFRWDLRP